MTWTASVMPTHFAASRGPVATSWDSLRQSRHWRTPPSSSAHLIVAEPPASLLGRAPGIAPLTMSTVVAAALGWATLLLVARSTDQSAYSSFAILWGIFYGFAGICAGLQQ